MKKSIEEMTDRLRTNREKNLRNYKRQSNQANERISDLERLSQRNDLATRRLREEHLKTN